jgi:hypothetical protein
MADALLKKVTRAASKDYMEAILHYKHTGSILKIERLPLSLEREVAMMDFYQGNELASIAKNAIKLDNR